MTDAPAELLHELFERQAEARPHQTAVICGSTQLSYEELERRANRLARLLRRRGIKRGDCVGLLLPRSAEVYIALLGILKAGAAYVPLDPDYPAERVSFILSDCNAAMVIATRELAARVGAFRGPVLESEEAWIAMSSLSDAKLARAEVGANPQDLGYVIYTSGTTGQPKGVQIEHRSVCHLVRMEGRIFQVQPEDRVFQGASIAFDASVEEIWLAFFAGATLIAGTPEMVHSGPALSRTLSDAGVTVLSTVPTLLLMMAEDIASLRLLILGGEICPPELVKRWWKPGRRVVNTYGPTEATVIASCAECHPDRPITIGRPLPGYSVFILDEHLRPVAPGTAGELCLGGIGLARGYVGRPQLTQEKFFAFTQDSGSSQRLYRTGDRARWNPEGEIEFLGRLDTQVKIRGFRVELGEIESVLMTCPQVKAAAVSLREDAPGIQQLVAYLVPCDGKPLDDNAIRARLRARLPPYMIPAWLETLPVLPTLASGKIDRQRLPAPRGRKNGIAHEIVPPRTLFESEIKEVWAKLFAPAPISVRDDFFLELGGHSLLAARMVSELRGNPKFAGVSMLDIYQHPTIESLAAKLEITRRPSEESKSGNGLGSFQQAGTNLTHPGIPFWRHFFCGTAQLVSLVFILSFFALQWLAPYLTYTVLIEEEYDVPHALVGALGSLILLYPLMLVIPIALKWLVIGRYRSGTYPLWGAYYFRWWLVTTIEAAVPVGYLAGTPLLNIYLRLMGARIGQNVHLNSDSFAIYDLLAIGDDSSINADSNLLGYTIEDGLLRIGHVRIGKRCFVGARAALCEDTVVEDDSALEDLSLLPRGGRIPSAETWLGSPARRIEDNHLHAKKTNDPRKAGDSTMPASPLRPSGGRRFAFGLLHGAGLLFFPVLVVLPLFPGIMVMNELNYLDPYYWYLLLAPLVGLSFVVLLALEIALVKWLLLGRVKPGHFPLHSWYYFRKWFFDQTMDLSLDVLGPLYASVYLTPWYKLLGARLGRGAEVSTASFISPDLLSLGEESFIADSVSLGAPRVRNGFLTLGRNQVGKRSFIGNSALLPPDTVIGDEVLIGCLSVPPSNPADALRTDSAWIGSPAIFLPQRQRNTDFSAETTFNPSAKLRSLRAAIEFLRVIAPSTGFIILLSVLFSSLLLLRDALSLFETLLLFPFLYLGCGLAAAALTIAVKWLLVWRYRPCEKPLWSTFVWRNELVNALHEHLAEPFLVGALTGTPFICWYFRLLGARIGRRVYMETTDLSEFDLVLIGDEAALNADCTIQTHLFEDRVMKMAPIEIGPGAQVGAGSLVLYNTHVQDGATIRDLSLLMKGETLPARTTWEGIPARPSTLIKR